MTPQFDDDINIFKKSKSRKNKKDHRLHGKDIKPKGKPRDHDYHLIAREKKIFERKKQFEKILWE